MDQADVGASVRPARGNAALKSRRNVSTSAAGTSGLSAAAVVGLVAGAGDGDAPPRRREEQPAARQPADRGCRGERARHEVQRRATGSAPGGQRAAEQLRGDAIALGPVALTTSRAEMSKRPRRARGRDAGLRSDVDDAHAADAAAVDERRVGPQIRGDAAPLRGAALAKASVTRSPCSIWPSCHARRR